MGRTLIGADAVAVGDIKRPIARLLDHRRSGILAAVKVELVADDQAIQIDHQQGILRSAAFMRAI